MNGDLLVFVLILIGFCVGGAVTLWHRSRFGTPVENWARANGFKLISEERDYLASSHLLRMSVEQLQVFRIVVHDREGRTRTGRLDWSGRPLDQMRVTWDENKS